MKKILLVALLAHSFALAESTFSVNEFKEFYKSNLKKKCKMSGIRFAQSHTVEQWENFDSVSAFNDEMHRICPNTTTITLDSDQAEMFQVFVSLYGRDSKEIRPEC